MAYDIALCNSIGDRMLGSDGNFKIDKRFCLHSIKITVSEYRESHRKNFPHKAEYWTHFKYKGRVWKI